jgi:flagellum-specific peptidoglycan hydrolase FlgJ
MKASSIRRYAPLLVVIGVVLYRELRGSDAGVLGSRTMEAIDYFKRTLEPIALKVQGETGFSSRLGVTQAALESSNGTSKLSRPDAQLEILPARRLGPALNIFGFKCGDGWLKAGRPYVMLPTKDYYKKGQKMPNGEIATVDGQALVWPAPFRAYSSWEESYRDWARLMQIPVYVADGAPAALRADDMKAFGDALDKHYAPNQNYATRLENRAREIGTV